MSVTSTTLAGVNVWRFSGAVTDAEVKTAWASLIVNQRYKPGRYIYIDDTCSLVNVRGTYYVDCEALGIILHSSRNKANTVFANWTLVQTAGLSVGSRANFVRVTNGTTITTSVTDGIDMRGGDMIYAVQGNPGGGDPRYLNEMMFGALDGTNVTSVAYTEQELEPSSIGTIWRGLKLQKVSGFPILQTAGGTQRQVVYRCELNTEGTQKIVRPYYNNSVCYVSSLVRRNGVAVTSNLYDTYASGAGVIMVLNNYTDESWFGVAKTAISGSNWSAGNRFIGGVMKKIQVQPSTVIRTYDSRSTAVSQKSTFSETTSDFLTGTGTTNLALYSEQLDNGYWTKGNTTIAANDANSPIGTLTADKVREDTANAQHRINTSAMTAVSGQPYTYSFYAKAAERSFVHVRMISSGTTTNAEACFNLTDGTVLNGTGTSTITDAGGGYFRCTVTGNPTTTSVICYANMALSSSLTVPVYTGTANAGMHMWGHQFERSSVATNYVATTSAISDGGYSTTADETTGRAQFVSVAAIATGGSCSITRYTGQRFTLQKFGYRVQVETPDMAFGDDDLSAYSPITMTVQNGLVRDLATINADTSIDAYRELLEELHVLAIGLSGAASYNGAYGGNLFELSGNQLNTSFTFVLVDKTAAQKISYNATTGALIIKSDTLASSTSVTQWSNTTGPITTANGATITGVYADSNGQRVRVFGLDPEGFGVTWYLRHRVKGTSTWTNLSGTGNQTLVILTAGEYEFQARVPGYDWDDAEIDTAVSLSLDMALRYQVSANNTPQYTMVYDAVLEAIFAFDDSVNKVSVTNATSGILSPGFAELYQATQRIQHIPDLVWTWTSPVTANATSQKILIPTGNPISMFLTDASTNSVKITCPVIHADTGSSADDRVRGNPSGYSIILGSPATAESAGLANQIISSLGGPNYDGTEHGLSVIKGDQDLAKAVLDLVKSAVDAIKPRTDLIPDAPAAVGDAMTLTTAYDAAKTAATQSSVDGFGADLDALSTDLDTLDQLVQDLPTLTEIEGSTVLAKTTTAMTLDAAYDAAKTAATQTSVDAVAVDVDAIGSVVVDLPTLSEIEATTVLAKATDVTAVPAAVRTELATELAHLDADVSSRSTLTAQDIPEGLTAAEVWAATSRTLTETPGLTDTQAEQLRKMAQLHGIGATLVVTETARTAGDVSQTITTTDEQTTVSAA